jgi:hypothetical protein
MHRVALLALLLTMTGCAGTGFPHFLSDTFTYGTNPNLPVSDALNMARAMGQTPAVEPMEPEAGTIWPGPPEPTKTLQDLERDMPSGDSPPVPPMRSQHGEAAPPAKSVPVVVSNADGTSTILHPDGRVEIKTTVR